MGRRVGDLVRAGSTGRGVGWDGAGMNKIKLPRELQGNARGQQGHRCHVLWSYCGCRREPFLLAVAVHTFDVGVDGSPTFFQPETRQDLPMGLKRPTVT